MKLSKLQLLLIIAISAALGYFGGVNKVQFSWKNYKPQVVVQNREAPPSVTSVDLAPFWDVWDKVSSMYYDKSKVDPKKMLQGAITGMVQSLGDPYTVYLPPVQNTNFQQQLAGKFEGIGAELGMKDNQIIVVAPLDGSPAQKAGIKAGDAILRVETAQTDGWTLQQAVDKIRGPKGTTVNLTVLHKGDKDVTKISIVRDTIRVKSVFGWVKSVKDIEAINKCHTNLDPNSADAACSDKIIYLRLSQFGDSTNQDWLALINQLIAEDGNPKGMVLDLRNNPGGYLEDATFIAGEFLPQGDVVVKQDDGKGNVTSLTVNRKGSLMTIPLVVLLNGGSASASEIVSGALRDHKRAKLVGEQSFGKGTIQQALDLGQGAGLHVTIAKWLTPNDTWVHGVGLTPDIKTELDPKDPSHDTQLESAVSELLK